MIFTDEQMPSTLEYIRLRRNSGLKNTDWTQFPDAPLSDELKEKFKIYRQELRDLPTKYTDEDSIIDVIFPEWPIPLPTD